MCRVLGQSLCRCQMILLIWHTLYVFSGVADNWQCACRNGWNLMSRTLR